MLLTEITKIDPIDYSGSDDEVGHLNFSDAREKAAYEKRRSLPGGSGLEWFAMKDPKEVRFFIADPDFKPSDVDDIPVIGKMVIEQGGGGDLWSVDTVSVLEKYRGKKIGLALYGIALSIFKLTLASGDAQTPSGAKMWQVLSTIPGVKISGLIRKKKTFVSDKTFTDDGLKIFNDAKDKVSDSDKALASMVKTIGGKDFDVDENFYIIPVNVNGSNISSKYFNVYGTFALTLVAKKD